MHILKTLVITLLLPVFAQAIPLSVLHAQKQERENIEAALRTVDKNCAECREQIVAALHHYVAGMQSNTEFCVRLGEDAGSELKEISEAIKEYQAHREWARKALRNITRKEP